MDIKCLSFYDTQNNDNQHNYNNKKNSQHNDTKLYKIQPNYTNNTEHNDTESNTLSKMTISITTLSMITIKCNNQHNIMVSFVMPSFDMKSIFAQCYYGDWCYAECRGTQTHSLPFSDDSQISRSNFSHLGKIDGVTTSSITTVSIKTLRIMTFLLCWVFFLMNVIDAECHKKPFMQSVIMLNVVLLSVVMLNVVAPY